MSYSLQSGPTCFQKKNHERSLHTAIAPGTRKRSERRRDLTWEFPPLPVRRFAPFLPLFACASVLLMRQSSTVYKPLPDHRNVLRCRFIASLHEDSNCRAVHHVEENRHMRSNSNYCYSNLLRHADSPCESLLISADRFKTAQCDTSQNDTRGLPRAMPALPVCQSGRPLIPPSVAPS